MWKMVLGDMRYGAKEGVKQVFREPGSWYIYFYLLAFAPVFFDIGGGYLLSYYFALVPMLLALLMSRMYAGRADKALYLCPLSREERKRYWLISWALRAGAPVLLSLLLNGALLALGILSLLPFVLVAATNFLYAAAVNLYCRPVRDSSRFMERRYPLPGHYEAWNVAVQLFGVITILAATGLADDLRKTEGASAFDTAAVLALFFCHALPAVLMLVKYFRPVLEHEAVYEEAAARSEEERQR